MTRWTADELERVLAVLGPDLTPAEWSARSGHVVTRTIMRHARTAAVRRVSAGTLRCAGVACTWEHARCWHRGTYAPRWELAWAIHDLGALRDRVQR